MLSERSKEIGRKTIWSCGLPSIPAVVVEKLALVNANERVRTEFWYTLSGKVLYEDPRHHSKRTSEEPFLHLEEFVANEINEIVSKLVGYWWIQCAAAAESADPLWFFSLASVGKCSSP